MKYTVGQEVQVVRDSYFGFSINKGDVAKVLEIDSNGKLKLEFDGQKIQHVGSSRLNVIKPALSPFDLMMSGKYNVGLRVDGTMILFVMGNSYINIGKTCSAGTHGSYDSFNEDLIRSDKTLSLVKMGTVSYPHYIRSQFDTLETSQVRWGWSRPEESEIKVGDEVVITHSGKCYDTDSSWMMRNATTKECCRMAYESTPVEGKTYKVLKVVDKRYMVSANTTYSPIYVMNEKGIQLK